MSALVTVNGLTKAFTHRPLFTDLNLSIESGDRVGLIGPNGAGKTTLLKIIGSKIDPDGGKLFFQKGLRVGFLEQSPSFDDGATVLSTILSGFAHPEDPRIHGIAYEFISRLGLTQFGADGLVAHLSGGWKKRLALGRELVKEPDLLLLDEPTNHLDVESILWLENYLANAPFALMTVTHDRLFLQRVSNRIIELNPRHAGGLLSIRGDYTEFLEARELRLIAQENRETIMRNTLRRETEWLRQGAKARTTKQQARIKSAGELKEQVEELSQRNQSRTTGIDFQSGRRGPKRLLEAKELTKSFGDQVLFEDFNLLLAPRSKVGLLGPNGCGKSTLIQTLIGTAEATSGRVFRADQLVVAYFDQRREELDPNVTLTKTLCPDGDHVIFRGQPVHISSYLDRFLFTKDQMQLKVGKLSGGEQSRLLIARLMLTSATLLVLDEPTNDLDIATLDILQECLKDFDGAIILVTHDRYFLDQVCNQIYAFPSEAGGDRHLIAFADYSQWEAWHLENAKHRKAQNREKKAEQEATSAAGVKKKKLTFKDQFELDGIEATINQAEKNLEDLLGAMALPENLSNASVLTELTVKIAAAQSEIERLYKRWQELETK